ncbi:MAG: hypothetical protein PHQ43_13210 [Dehalococcoidales bacterium]|nr:hypothetical protein [Dehalococcoidales bacterium]
MAWWEQLKNMFAPKPASQGLPIEFAPAAAAPKQLTGGAAATYGNLVELLADGANLTDAWVTHIHAHTPDTANTDYGIALSREAAAAPPAKIEAQVPTHSQTTVAADHHEVIPLDPPAYFPAGTGIRAACYDVAAGGKKISVWVQISRGRSST